MRIVIVFLGILASEILSAQNYTYLRAELGLTTTKLHIIENYSLIDNTLFEGGGAMYGFYLRREISEMLSFEIGYSYRMYSDQIGLISNYYASTGGIESHQIPFKLNLNIDVFKDRISMFASFGYLFCIEESNGGGSSSTLNSDGKSILLEWKFIPESKFNSLLSTSTGCRFRVYDQLLLEMELGYIFGFKNLIEYNVTYWDDSGVLQALNSKGKGEYYYFKLGLSYPIQRVQELLAMLKLPGTNNNK
ncbi:MAG: hypothetical protein KAS71_18415 [Bacteroidales bacterium]|nr:hypothetical protein [Bacteroidales bacterium]